MSKVQAITQWIKRFIIGGSIFVGIVLLVVGGAVTLNAGLKLALFDTDSYGNSYEIRECEGSHKYNEEKGLNEYIEETDLEKVDACKARIAEDEKKDFKNSKKHQLVDGISTLVAGLVVVGVFGIWSRRIKREEE